jgi:hypothetical protein
MESVMVTGMLAVCVYVGMYGYESHQCLKTWMDFIDIR